MLWLERGISFTGSCAPTRVAQQVVLFGEVAVPLGGEVLLVRGSRSLGDRWTWRVSVGPGS